ncbi:unnamed protein product [Fusarium langsethiae]|nr:unnamed protein product [Fusarium langsethiae]
MDVEANRSAEKLVLLVTQKRRKRADTEHAANSCRLKRHRSNQHLNSGAEAHLVLVHSDERVYQQDTISSKSSLSPENGQQLLVHPGQDNVASGSTRAHADTHSDHLPISTLRRSPYCGQSLGFGPTTQSDGQQDQGKFPSPPEEDSEGENASGQDPEVLELRRSKPEFDSVPGRQGRGVRKPSGSLLSPEQEKGSPSQEEVAAQAPAPAPTSLTPARPQTQLREGPSLNLGSILVTPGLNLSKACDFPTLHPRRPIVDSCCGITQDSHNDNSSDDDEVPIVKFGNIDFENDLRDHRDLCGDTVANRPAKPLLFAVIRACDDNDRPEDIDCDYDDGGTNGELGESIECSQDDATNSHVLSHILGATALGDPDPEEYTSDDHANNASPSPSPEQNVCSSPSDTNTLDQESSSEAASFHEDSDYEVSGHDQSGYRINKEEVEYSSGSCEVDDDSPDENVSSALTPPIATSGRRRLTSEEREAVRLTREVGACVRCRFQKIKCFPDPKKPEGKCKTCKRFSKASSRTIHRVPCLRLRIIEIVLYRSGGLNLTRRWEGIEMRDIPERLSTTVITIQVSQDFCKKPIFMEVVQFIPIDGDVTARYWTECRSGKMTLKKKELATYCLKNIYETAKDVRRYTVENALPAFLHSIQGESTPVVFRTYYVAMRRYVELSKEKRSGNEMSKEDKREVEILGNLFVLWCAIQHTVGSLYIHGEETLGMRPETQDKSYPLYGKISAPRMIVAQFDNLVYNWVLETYKEKLLRDVDWLFSQDKNRWWFTIYTILFILLREVSRMTADRYRHARDNFGPQPRYSIPAFVEDLHGSCNNILTHWHYYNCNKWPKNKDEENTEHFANLAADDLDLVRQTRRDKGIKQHLSVWKQYKTNNGKVDRPVLDKGPEAICYTGSQDKFDWDHPLYWVAQMFEKNWYPHPTYQREPVPKNHFPTPISTPS